MKPRYTALIRTFNSGPLVFDTIAALRAQTCPPSTILVVDSGTDGPELDRLKAVADRFIDISDRPFNYSHAINVGLPQCEGSHVLVISSHIGIASHLLIERAWAAMNKCGADGFYCTSNTACGWKEQVINRSSFSGSNGLSNSCGFVPLPALEQRQFKEEVFSAEDQEWSVWFLRERGKALLRIETQEISYLNQRLNYTKMINEELAIAYFVDRRRLGLLNIVFWMFGALGSLAKGKAHRCQFKLAVARGLWAARSRQPVRSSKYF